MGCICCKSIQDVDSQTADIRASSPVHAFRHQNHAGTDQSVNAVLGVSRHQHPPRLTTSHSAPTAVAALRHSRSAPRTGSANGLSHTPWKQVRNLLRSNTNPHYHQIQQLQLVSPSSSTLHQSIDSQLHNADSVGAEPHGRLHRHHHQSNVIQSMGLIGLSSFSPTLSRVQSAELSLAHSVSGGHPSSNKQGGPAVTAAAVGCDALSPEQVLSVCAAVLEDEPQLAAAGVQPLLLAALCLIESGGCPHVRQYRDHLGDVALGLCQMLLSTAQWLASSKGFDRYGTAPTASDLQEPKVCVYYCAAYLSILGQHDGCTRTETFIVKAYHAGPKGIDANTAGAYLQKYLKAKHCLQQVVRSMAVTVAAAAAAAGVPIALSAVTDTAAAEAADSSEQPHQDHSAMTQQQQHGRKAASKPSCPSKSSSSSTQQCSTCSTDTKRQVLVFACTAQLIATLSSRWDPASDESATEPGSAAGTTGGTLMSRIMPARAARQQQQQQVQSHQDPGARKHGSSNGSTLLRRWRSNSAVTAASSSSTHNSSSAVAAALAPVSVASMQSAMLRMSYIDSIEFSTAFSNAGIAAAAAVEGSGCGSSAARRVGSAAAASHSKSCNNSNDDLLAALPCVMHMVGHGETLAQIATICGTGVADILAVNPDLPNLNAVQADDCIALPLPVIPPRLRVIQYGDTLHGIAKAHKVPLGRLIAKNPELVDPGRVQPGWVITLPGLKGDSKSGLGMDWLAQAAVAAAEEEAADLECQRLGVVENAVSDSQFDGGVLCWQQDVQHQRHHRPDQHATAAAAESSVVDNDVAADADAAAAPGTSPFASWACVALSSKTAAHGATPTAAARTAAAVPVLPPLAVAHSCLLWDKASTSPAALLPAVQLLCQAVVLLIWAGCLEGKWGSTGTAGSWAGEHATAAAASEQVQLGRTGLTRSLHRLGWTSMYVSDAWLPGCATSVHKCAACIASRVVCGFACMAGFYCSVKQDGVILGNSMSLTFHMAAQIM